MYGYWIRQPETVAASIFAYYQFGLYQNKTPHLPYFRQVREGQSFKSPSARQDLKQPRPKIPCGDGTRYDRRASSERRDSPNRRGATTRHHRAASHRRRSGGPPAPATPP